MGSVPVRQVRSLLLLAFSVALSGCFHISDRPPQTVMVRNLSDSPKQFILLGVGQYEGELTFSLIKQGFKIVPFAARGDVTEVESPTRLIEYKQAGFKYALKASIAHEYGSKCVFSGGHVVNVTLSVVDIETNEVLAIIKQTGPDGPCPPLTPVWELLANELARVWK